MSALDVGSVVREDLERSLFQVDRRAYTDPAIAELEQSRVFERCWIYAAHESEIPTPGSYLARRVVGRPVIVARGDDGRIRVFANSCTHRGALVCRHDAGTSKSFQCPYHFWTFSNQGDLIGVPGQDAYGAGFDRKNFALPQYRVESYRGFIFVTFNVHAEPLVDYLADAREYLDLIDDQSETGMEIITGSQPHGARANWKLMMENSVDIYHFRLLHRRYVEYIESTGATAPRERRGLAKALGNGHAVIELPPAAARPLAYWTPMFEESLKPELAALKQRFVDKYGEERATKITETNRALLVFPNLMVIDAIALTVRTMYPNGPADMAITSWALAPKDESARLRELRLSHYLTFLGPGGFATPDDVEVVESCQLGYLNTNGSYSDLSRGMDRNPPMSTDELPARVFWQRWHQLMTQADSSARDGSTPSELEVAGAGLER